jgi:hypothetical protein
MNDASTLQPRLRGAAIRGLLSATVLAFLAGPASPQVLNPGLPYTAIQPCRLVDTRNAGGALAPGITRFFTVAGATAPGSLDAQGGNPNGCPVPGKDSYGQSQTQAVMVNLIAVGPAGAGDLRAWPTGSPTPNASVLNYAAVAGLNIANGIILPLTQDIDSNDLSVRADVSGTHLVMDVVGYFAEVSAAASPSGGLNLFIGRKAGNQAVSAGTGNTAFGTYAMNSLTSAEANVSFGWGTLGAEQDGGFNTAIGAGAMGASQHDGFNTALGYQALKYVNGGSSPAGWSNIGVGAQAGSHITTGNSNIHLGADSASDESNTLRIGAQGSGLGQQNRAFMAGINGVTIGSPNLVLIDPATTQLGAESLFGSSWGGSGANSLYLTTANTAGNWFHLQNTSSGGKDWSIISTGSGNGEGSGKLVLRDATDLADGLTLDGSGNLTLPSLAPGGAVSADANGTLILSASDARLKKDVVALPDEIDLLETLGRLRGVAFNWDTALPRARTLGEKREIGMIAQEVEPVLPQIVGTGKDGYKSIDYAKLSAFLVEVAKLQQAEISRQRAEIDALRQEVQAVAHAIAPAP